MRAESVTGTALVRQEPINILLVDDEPANLLVLETVLDDPGYRLVRAQSADQALLALMEEEFAVLILDVRMPDLTGFQLAQMIKERRKTADIPIIFLTAYYDTDQQMLEGYDRGAVDYLNKPVNPAVLRSKVSVFADLHRKSRALASTNQALLAEVGERRRAEEQLRELNDTLERKVRERTEALRRADDRLQVMMSSITDGLLMLDLDWCFTYVNEQGARLLALRPEQLLGARASDQLPSLQGTFLDGCRRAVQTRQTVSFELLSPGSSNRWLQCHCYPSDDGLSVYFHDITDRHEVEARRDQLLRAELASRSESERVARAKDEFLAFLSHELRTPLAAIVGWVDLVSRPTADAETLRRGIDAIARNARAQSRLVDDLLDMSRIVSGKLRISLEGLELNKVAAAAADSARPAGHAKSLSIELHLADEPLEIMGDAARLQQIVANLVSNALKFTPAGGVITIATASEPSHAVLTVSDTGEGLSPEFLPHLFDRFSQADGSDARLHGGLGLGLSIVKTLVELHGGRVTATSEGKGLGSSFTVRLPRASATVARSAQSTVSARAGGTRDGGVPGPRLDEATLKGVSVLLVDDHEDVLEVERRFLVDHGAVVTTSTSTEEALQLLRSNRFDALLSDIGMPGQDGYGFIKDVRTRLGLTAEVLPAAAVTAFVRAEDQQRALSYGYQACIQKPVSPSELVRTVALLLRKGKPSDPSLHRKRHALRTLFVEDNEDLRIQIGEMLVEEGLEVVSCATGEDAKFEFQRGQFDVLVTDVSLPAMSGVELARWTQARSPQTWVVFSTGYPMEEQLCKLGSRFRALLKPFDREDLHRVMNEIRAQLPALAD